MAAYFPNKPSTQDQENMTQFLRLFSQFYPCPVCAKDFSRLLVLFILYVRMLVLFQFFVAIDDVQIIFRLDRHPPKTGSQLELTQWMCWAHNQVNMKLGKPKFDCSKVNERWKDGWKDGSCDP